MIGCADRNKISGKHAISGFIGHSHNANTPAVNVRQLIAHDRHIERDSRSNKSFADLWPLVAVVAGHPEIAYELTGQGRIQRKRRHKKLGKIRILGKSDAHPAQQQYKQYRFTHQQGYLIIYRRSMYKKSSKVTIN